MTFHPVKYEVRPGFQSMSNSLIEHPLVVSFYTDSFYLREAYELLKTCQTYHVDHLIAHIPSSKEWALNTMIKPLFLRTMAHLFPDRTIVWLDADSRIRSEPILFYQEEFDVGFHTYLGQQPASGVVVLPPTKKRALFLQCWIDLCDSLSDKRVRLGDQICLQTALYNSAARHYELPKEYCWIYDLPEMDPTRSIVIEQMQASRIAKKLRPKT